MLVNYQFALKILNSQTDGQVEKRPRVQNICLLSLSQ